MTLKLVKYKPAQTFTALIAVVHPARWTVTACSTTRCVSAGALAVASAVVCLALVHV